MKNDLKIKNGVAELAKLSQEWVDQVSFLGNQCASTDRLLEKIIEKANEITQLNEERYPIKIKQFRWYPAKRIGHKTYSQCISNPQIFSEKQQKTAERCYLRNIHGNLYMDEIVNGKIVQTYSADIAWTDKEPFKKVVVYDKI